jgi:hypothetical protein
LCKFKAALSSLNFPKKCNTIDKNTKAVKIGLEDRMGSRRDIVVTTYGHDRIIDKIAVSSFEGSENSSYARQGSDAETYCDTINALELNGGSWVFARILHENTQYGLSHIMPLNFSEVIAHLDDRALQKMMRDVDSQDLAKAMLNQTETIKERIFNNMSGEASRMIKEDMEYMGPVRLKDVMENQEKILNIIRRLDQSGEIIINLGGDVLFP